MYRALPYRRLRRHLTGSVVLAALLAAVLSGVAGCGTSAAGKVNTPVNDDGFAGVACNDAGWAGLTDYARIVLLQAGLYLGVLRPGSVGGPPAGAAWLVDGKIDPRATDAADFRNWVAGAGVQAYLKPLEDREAAIKKDHICSRASADATVSFPDYYCKGGGQAEKLAPALVVSAYMNAILGQAALNAGRIKQGTTDGPPTGVPWLVGGELTPDSYDVGSAFQLWAGVDSASSQRNASYQTFSEPLSQYQGVVTLDHLCGVASANLVKDLAAVPSTIAPAP